MIKQICSYCKKIYYCTGNCIKNELGFSGKPCCCDRCFMKWVVFSSFKEDVVKEYLRHFNRFDKKLFIELRIGDEKLEYK